VTEVTLALWRPLGFSRWRPLLGLFVLSRLVTVAAFLLLKVIEPRGLLGSQFYNQPLGLFGAWDGVWYQRVAQHGYLLIPGKQSDPAFFPLFPILLRGVHSLGLSYTAAGVVIANVSFAVAVIAFYELGRRVVAEPVAARAAGFVAIAPMAFVFSMSYPESLLLAFVVLALLAAFADRWLAAAALMAAAVLTRPEALTFSIPLAAIAWSHRGRLDPSARGRALAATLAAPLALACFPLYLKWALGDVHAWQRAQREWGRIFRLDGPARAVYQLPSLLGHHPLLARDLILLAGYALLLWVAARSGIDRAWIVAGALLLVLPLFSGTIESEGRFGLIALPVYWGAASLRLSPRGWLACRAGCLALLAAGVLTLAWLWP
jgi:hypothetical protein